MHDAAALYTGATIQGMRALLEDRAIPRLQSGGWPAPRPQGRSVGLHPLLVGEPLDGAAGIDAALAFMGSPDTFVSLFDDWVVAAFLDERPQLCGRICSLGSPCRPAGDPYGVQPLLGSATVANYATLYLDFPPPGGTTFQAVVDGIDGAPLQAALIAWDSAGISYLRWRGSISPTRRPAALFRCLQVTTGTPWRLGPGCPRSRGFSRVRLHGCRDPPGGIQFLDMEATMSSISSRLLYWPAV